MGVFSCRTIDAPFLWHLAPRSRLPQAKASRRSSSRRSQRQLLPPLPLGHPKAQLQNIPQPRRSRLPVQPPQRQLDALRPQTQTQPSNWPDTQTPRPQRHLRCLPRHTWMPRVWRRQSRRSRRPQLPGNRGGPGQGLERRRWPQLTVRPPHAVKAPRCTRRGKKARPLWARELPVRVEAEFRLKPLQSRQLAAAAARAALARCRKRRLRWPRASMGFSRTPACGLEFFRR